MISCILWVRLVATRTIIPFGSVSSLVHSEFRVLTLHHLLLQIIRDFNLLLTSFYVTHVNLIMWCIWKDLCVILSCLFYQNLTHEDLDPLIPEEILQELFLVLAFEGRNCDLVQIMHRNIFWLYSRTFYILKHYQSFPMPQFSFQSIQMFHEQC